MKLFRFLLKLELSTTIIESSKTKKNKSTWRPQGSRMPVLQTRWLGDWSFLFGAPWHLFLHPKPPEAPNSSAPSRLSLGRFPSNVFFAKKKRQVVSTFFFEREASTKQRSAVTYISTQEKTPIFWLEKCLMSTSASSDKFCIQIWRRLNIAKTRSGTKRSWTLLVGWR